MLDIGADTERFFDKVMPEPNTGCWLWLAGLSSAYKPGNGGYGIFHLSREQGKQRQVKAHRFLFEKVKGPLSKEQFLDHRCRLRCCVNPDHLEITTTKENLHRSPIWTGNKLHCSCCGDFLEIYAGERRCRSCKIKRNREWRHNRRNQCQI